MIPDIHMIVAGDAILQGFSRILLDLLLNLLCKFFLFPVAPLRPKSQKIACLKRAQGFDRKEKFMEYVRLYETVNEPK